MTCFLFSSVVGAEKEDSQGYHKEQTKGTAVTEDLLLKKGNTIGHGTETIPTENTLQHSAVAVAAKFPGAVSVDTRPTAPHETTQITKALPTIALPSREHFVSRNGQSTLTSRGDNPSAVRIHNESEIPLISNYEKIISSSAQAAFKSMMNGPSEPDAHLSAHAVKASLWPHTLRDNRNQRNTDSTLASADGGPGVPILSASHPHVIDNLAAPRNDNTDKQSQGKVEKGISELGRNGYLFGTMQSIFQSDAAEDSGRGNTVTDSCLTCLKDRRPASAEKSVALPALSPDGSSDPLSTERLALDFHQFTTSLPSLQQQSAGEQEEILNKDISDQNVSKHSRFGVKERLVYSLTFPPFSFNKTANHSESILNNSQVKSFLTDAVAFDTRPLAEMSSATQKDARKQARHTYLSETSVTERQSSTTAAFHRSSKPPHAVRKPGQSGEQDMFGKKASSGNPQSKLIYLSKEDDYVSHRLSTNFSDAFIQNQALNVSSGPISSTPVVTETPRSSQGSVHPEGNDRSPASHPTARVRLGEAQSATMTFRLSGPTTPAVQQRDAPSLTGRAEALSSVLRSQTPATPSSQTKEPLRTMLLKDSAITSAALDPQEDSDTFNSVQSFAKEAFVDPSGPASKPDVKEQQTSTIRIREAAAPVKLFLLESRQDSDDEASMSTLTTLPSMSFSERLTMSRFLGSQSKITRERTLDVGSDNHVASTLQSFVEYNRDLFGESLIVHNLEPGDKNHQVLTVAAENEVKEIIRMEAKQGEKIKETKEILKLQEEKEESREGEKLGNKSKELFGSDKMESGKQENIINSGEEINQNKDREEGEMEEPEAKTSGEEGGGTVGEQEVTLRQTKDPRQGEVRDEEAEKQRDEAASEEDIKHDREIGREDMTNVPLWPTPNSEELNRDKGHTVTNLSSCHCLIKELGAGEHAGAHLGENTAQIVEMKDIPFSSKVTSNHRLLHSTLRSQSPKLSRMTSFPIEPHTQMKPHPSTHRAVLTKHGATAALAKQSAQNEVVEPPLPATVTPKTVPKLSQTFGGGTSKFSDAFKPTIYPHSSAAKSAHPVLNRISDMLSLTAPRLAITAGFLRAQPHFTANSSTHSASIIYSVSDHRHEFRTSVSKANSLFQTVNERERAETIIPAHVTESSVEDPLTSNIIAGVKVSPAENPVLLQHSYNDSSTRPTTTTASSSEAHISTGQPHQEPSSPQISQPSSSSSFDMTSGQPCSFKLSEQTAHSDSLHAPADNNEQRSVQSLMASMSPKAKNDQFLLSSMSPLLNLVPFGGDSLPDTYSPTGLTRSAPERDILRASSEPDHANSGRGQTESLLVAADDTYQSEEKDMTMILAVEDSDSVTKRMAENKSEKNSSPFVAQTTGRSKPQSASNTESNSVSIIQTEKLAAKNTKDNNHSDLFNVDGDDGATTVKTALENNLLLQLGGYNEASTEPIMFTIQTTHKTEQAISEDSVPVMSDFVVPVLDTNDQTAFVESDVLLEIPQIQANDVMNNAISDMEHRAARTTEKRDDSSSPHSAVGVNTLPAAHSDFRGDLTVSNISTQQIVTSDFQITAAKTSGFVSLAPSASTSGLIVSTKDHEPALTSSESVPVVTEKTPQANSHLGHLSLRATPATPTTSKLPPAVKRKSTTEAKSVEEPEHEISAHAIERSQHAPHGEISTTRPVNDPGQGVQTGLLNAAHRARGAHDTAPTVPGEYTLLTKSAFEAKHPPHERTPSVHTLHQPEQRQNYALPEKTTKSQVTLGALTDSVPPAAISLIINKTSCRTIGCAKSDETTETTIGAGEIDHTASEKAYRTQAGNTGKEHFNAAHTPDTKPANGNCSTDCPVAGKATLQATSLAYAVLSPANSTSDRGHASGDETTTKSAESMAYDTSTKTWRVLAETDHSERHGTLEQARLVKKTAQGQSHRESSEAQEAIATGVTPSEPEATTAQTAVKTTERTTLSEKKNKTHLPKAEILEAQNATRSARAVSEGEAALRESGRRLLLPEPESEPELPRLKHRRSTSPHLHLSG